MSPQTQSAKKTKTHSLTGTFAWFVVVVSSYLILLGILAGPQYLGHHLKEGDVAEQDLVAPHRSMVLDEEKTQELCEIARHDVLPVLKRDLAKQERILQRLEKQLRRIGLLIQEEIVPMPVVSPVEAVHILEMPSEDFARLKQALLSQDFTFRSADPLAVAIYGKISAADKNERKAAGSSRPPGSPRKQNNKAGSSKKDKLRGKASESSNSSADKNNFESVSSKIIACREKYKSLKLHASSEEHKLLLVAASVKAEESGQFLSELNSAARRFLTKVSLHPYSDRHEWEEQIYEFLPDDLETSQRRNSSDLIASLLEPNVSVDEAASQAKVKEAVDAVKPVMKEIETGTVIATRGTVLKAEDLRALDSLGITEVSDPGLAAVIAIALFAAFLLFGLYLYTYETKLFFSPSAIALMSTVSIVTCVVAFFIGEKFPQFVPLPASTLILAVTYGRRLTGILSALILLFLNVSDLMSGPHIVAIAAASGMALGASIKRRRDLMLTGILVGCMQMLGYGSAVIIGGSNYQTANLGVDLPVEMLGGLISAIAAIGSLPILENIFGILTPYRIAELAEPDQPLMRQLEENAPGTYQHSLAVANLAEGGARAIGANVNLVHTGAMYHDIGKMVTPRYFIENQLGDKNPHDFIPPEESSAKVLAHVTNGLALAQKYGLPKAVQAFIPEHQGTTIMAYFYHKACIRDGVENVDQNDYRYPGPKPQSKESAIVMLADVSEAVTHSMHDPSMEEVETAISNVFKARWEDGQFSESGLTSDELEKVKRGFVRVWRTLHHDRLKYPATTTGRMPVVPVDVLGSQPGLKTSQQSESASGTAADTSESAVKPRSLDAEPSAAKQNNEDTVRTVKDGSQRRQPSSGPDNSAKHKDPQRLDIVDCCGPPVEPDAGQN